jgi:hypothetical protein
MVFPRSAHSGGANARLRQIASHFGVEQDHPATQMSRPQPATLDLEPQKGDGHTQTVRQFLECPAELRVCDFIAASLSTPLPV